MKFIIKEHQEIFNDDNHVEAFGSVPKGIRKILVSLGISMMVPRRILCRF
ncbi:1401_t:CDS:2 [Rhizophagus irregularis]|nr:1401_t:CDS:2 [Rhizophagus irregularis]